MAGSPSNRLFFNRKINTPISIESNDPNLNYHIEGEEIEIWKDCPNEGLKSINFNIQLKNEKTFTINEEYIVAEPPKVLLNSTAGEILYLNQENEILLSVADIPPSQLVLESNSSKLEVSKDKYNLFYLKPIELGQYVVKVYDKSTTEKIFLFEKEFTVIKN